MTIGVGVANGKIILMGEHSVVYGKPAIALPFSKASIRCSVDFHESENSIRCIYYEGLLVDAPSVLDGVKVLVESTLKHLDKPEQGINLNIESDLPPQRGLGSSAAVSVAVVRSLFDAFKVPLSEEDLSNLVNIAEAVHHVNPSGLDASTIASGKVVYYQHGSEKRFIPMHLNGVIVVADTGKHGQTKQAVSEVRDLWIKNPDDINPILDRLGELTLEASEYLSTNNLIGLGKTMTEAHGLLRKINVSDDTLEQLVSVAIANGALGAKLTGGGKGGCMIALCSSTKEAEKMATHLRNAGATNTWFYDLQEIISDE